LKKSTSGIAVAIGWLLFVTILLCTPGSRLPKLDWSNKIWLDKWAHIFLFFILVLLWCRVYRLNTTSGLKKSFFIILIISVIYGITMEIVQHYFVPFRSFAYADMVADAIGSAAGYLVSVRRFIKK
jgi:VanZ family protein